MGAAWWPPGCCRPEGDLGIATGLPTVRQGRVAARLKIQGFTVLAPSRRLSHDQSLAPAVATA